MVCNGWVWVFDVGGMIKIFFVVRLVVIVVRMFVGECVEDL